MKKERISELTRQELANSLFSLMAKEPLDRISVRKLTEACGVPRSTFYYHFTDIYDLASWGLSSRLIECLSSEGDCLLWGKGLLALFQKSREYHAVCRCAVNSAHVWDMADSYCARCMDSVIVGLKKLDGDRNTDPDFLYFIGRFYGHAILAELVRWFRSDMSQPAESVTAKLDFFVKDNIVAALDKAHDNPQAAKMLMTAFA